MNKIETIKKQLVKQAIALRVGGFKPTYSPTESWIGKVYLYQEQEEIPTDKNGEPMLPLLQLYFENLPFVPRQFTNTKALTVFISKELPMELTPNGENWMLREYSHGDELVIKNLENSTSPLKAFPLKPELLVEDYPVWDSGDLSPEIEDDILALEESGVIGDYYEIAENQDVHKMGGYPSFCQPGIYFGDDYEFALQIVSDEKVNLNIVDNGTLFLAKNSKTQAWKYYCDFY